MPLPLIPLALLAGAIALAATGGSDKATPAKKLPPPTSSSSGEGALEDDEEYVPPAVDTPLWANCATDMKGKWVDPMTTAAVSKRPAITLFVCKPGTEIEEAFNKSCSENPGFDFSLLRYTDIDWSDPTFAAEKPDIEAFCANNIAAVGVIDVDDGGIVIYDGFDGDAVDVLRFDGKGNSAQGTILNALILAAGGNVIGANGTHMTFEEVAATANTQPTTPPNAPPLPDINWEEIPLCVTDRHGSILRPSEYAAMFERNVCVLFLCEDQSELEAQFQLQCAEYPTWDDIVPADFFIIRMSELDPAMEHYDEALAICQQKQGTFGIARYLSAEDSEDYDDIDGPAVIVYDGFDGPFKEWLSWSPSDPRYTAEDVAGEAVYIATDDGIPTPEDEGGNDIEPYIIDGVDFEFLLADAMAGA